jgi:hypothetical protein
MATNMLDHYILLSYVVRKQSPLKAGCMILYLSEIYINVSRTDHTKSKEILFILMRVPSRTCIENPVKVLPVGGSLTITVKRVL